MGVEQRQSPVISVPSEGRPRLSMKPAATLCRKVPRQNRILSHRSRSFRGEGPRTPQDSSK